MADTILPVQLNKGLDLVTPPLLAPEGALIDCLNYELTDVAGYRRIDGYERFDGYPNGDINEYFRITITAVNPLEQDLIIPGSVIQRVSDVATTDIGAVVGGPDVGNVYDFITFGSILNFSVGAPSKLLLEAGGAYLLEASGYILLEGETGGLGSTVQIKTPAGTIVEVTLGLDIVSGRDAVDTLQFLANIRAYSSVLRSLVTRAPGHIAGIHRFEDRVLAAIDAIRMTVSFATGGTPPKEGIRLRHNGTIYRAIKVEFYETTGGSDFYRVFLQPIGTSATVNDSLIEVTTADVDVTTWIVSVSGSGQLTTSITNYAWVGYYNTTATSTSRGFTPLPSSAMFSFDAGTYTGELLNPPVTLDDANPPSDAYYLVGGDGTVLRVRLTKVVRQDGTWATGVATGEAQVTVLDVIAGTRDYPKDNDVLHAVYPTTGTSAVLTVNGNPTYSAVAGTRALLARDTRYIWDTYNFYGQSATLSAYGVTGAGQAFWANEHGYGNIPTGVTVGGDIPKYISFHSGKLALGFARGSVLLSVVGEPYNFNGFDGALEIATGDDITGLLELPGETLAVFGKRAIRKITGISDVDTILGTIAAGSSCFDYTAALIGQEAVYCGVQGITSLQQSAAYGDFQGERISDPVSTWLRPKIVGTISNIESGGVALAYPVRSKNQYRLVLNTGEIVVATLTADGWKVMFSDHSIGNSTRIPFAWSSSIDDVGQEHIYVRWDVAGLEDLAFEVDKGWGFDGQYFDHYFDLAHTFNKHGSQFMGVEKVRMHGQGYGVATLNVKSSGIEDNFDQEYHDAVQDISMPPVPYTFYDRMKPVTSIIDQANWGIGIKLRIGNTTPEGSAQTEPPHMCQVLVLHLRTEGAGDN